MSDLAKISNLRVRALRCKSMIDEMTCVCGLTIAQISREAGIPNESVRLMASGGLKGVTSLEVEKLEDVYGILRAIRIF